MSENNQEKALDWGDDLNGGESLFKVLPEGKAIWRIKGFTKETHIPKEGAKLTCKCPKLNIALECISLVDGAKTTITHTLFWYSASWALDNVKKFFQAVGQVPENAEAMNGFKPNFFNLEGQTGVCVLNVEGWKGQDGTKFENNKIKKFMMPSKVTQEEQTKINEYFGGISGDDEMPPLDPNDPPF